jgi:uncharacterized protein (DUF2141 family)
MAVDYRIYVTGDCSNNSSGIFNLTINGIAPPYIFNWLNPNQLGVITSSITITNIINPIPPNDPNPPTGPTQPYYSYTVTGLSGGTYDFSITDASAPVNVIYGPYQFIISSGNSYSNIINVSGTTCGLDNGTFEITIPANTSSVDYYVYKDNVFFSSGVTGLLSTPVINLPYGVYYADIIGAGGCNTTTDSVIVHSGASVDFGFQIVNTTACNLSIGRAYITGLTGSQPFTYQWSNNITGDTTLSYVTGLTSGNYSVTVTSYDGCSITKSVEITNSPPIGISSITFVNPTCSSNNGSITFNISGGTSPYTYILSNGQTINSASQQVTFTNLSAGLYTLNVVDLGFCSYTTTQLLQTPNTFVYISETISQSTCDPNGGSATIGVQGGSPPYTYTLTNSYGNSTTYTTNLATQTFTTLSSDTYTLLVTDLQNTCPLTKTINVNNTPPFNLSVSSTPTLCTPTNSGTVTAQVSNGTSQYYTYSLSNGSSTPPTTATTYTFSGLNTGFYTVVVSEENGCNQSAQTYVDYTEPIQMYLYPTSCLDGNSGTISALITDTVGSYTLQWSDNVNGQTGIYLTGLTAGLYTLTVTSDSGCVTSQNTTISCNQIVYSSVTYSYSSALDTSETNCTFNFTNMLYSGYVDLTQDGSNCIFNSATFYVQIVVGTETYAFPFYITENLNDVPSIQDYVDILDVVATTIPEIDIINIDIETNSITIISNPGYGDEQISIQVVIEYDINCNSIGGVIC